jgi:hypothetical protein
MQGRDRVERIGWWCGIVAVVLILAGFLAIDEGGTSGPDASIQTLVDEIVSIRGRIVVGSLVGMVGALLLVWFGAALHIRLARQGDAGMLIGLAAFGSSLLMTAGALGHGSFRLSEASVSAGALSEAIRPLAILETNLTEVYWWGAIALVVAISVGGFAVRLIPKTLAGLGMVLSVVTVALTGTTHGGPAIALLPWLVVVCMLLLASRGGELAPAAPA